MEEQKNELYGVSLERMGGCPNLTTRNSKSTDKTKVDNSGVSRTTAYKTYVAHTKQGAGGAKSTQNDGRTL